MRAVALLDATGFDLERIGRDFACDMAKEGLGAAFGRGCSTSPAHPANHRPRDRRYRHRRPHGRQLLLGNTEKVEVDKQGRIVLPKHLLESANITKDVV